MNSIIVSDLHIGSRYFLLPEFEHFLETVSGEYELILNGDIIDNPCDILSPSHQRILDRLEQISLRQPVVWLQGNHEDGYAPNRLGKIVFKRRHSIGKRLLITHGDIFDKVMPNNQIFIKYFRLFHDLRLKLGATHEHVARYAKKWHFLYKFLRNNVTRNAVKYAGEKGYHAVACGHTHFPEDKMVNGIRYINTGAWTETPAFFLLVNGDGLRLKLA